MDGVADGPLDPRWEGSEVRLVEAIRDEILAAPDRRITFARFMERALTDPALGYYASTDLRPTRAGDFLTAPELHPFFGRCVGRFLSAAWRRAGDPDRFVVREHGAGRGTLRASALAGLAADGSALREAIEWQLLDLPGRSRSGDEPAHVVLANEYLDALPVHRLVHATTLREAYVSWCDDWFCEVLGAPSVAALASYLAADGVRLREGQRAEVCLAASRWLATAAGSLLDGGVVLVIDYGHDAEELYGPRRMAGSLLTYRHQRVSDDPFAAVGHTDITAHVDFTALERTAADAGLERLGRTSQGRFLAALGLSDLLAELGREPTTDPLAYLEARSAVARLIDPRHLGGFGVLAWDRRAGAGLERAPAGPRLPGFDSSA